MSPSSPLLPRVRDLAEYRTARGDPAIWLAALETICRRHGIDDSQLLAERSGTNVVFRAGKGPWIKLFPPLWLEDAACEQSGLAALAGIQGLEVPHPLAQGELEGWPYVVISHIPGQALREIWMGLDARARISLGEQVGRLMARLHAVDLSGCGPLQGGGATPLSARVAACLQRNRAAGLDATWMRALESYLEPAAALLTRPYRPVFLHADLTDDHLLARREGEGWLLTGLIDLGDATKGDPLYEFAAPAVYLAQRQPGVQRALLRGYGAADPDGSMGARIRAWTLLHTFSRIPELVRQCPEPMPRDLDTLLRGLWEIV